MAPTLDARPDSSQTMLAETLARIGRQMEAVGRASRLDALTTGDVNAAAHAIVELAAHAVGCARVNVWLFDEAENELRCIALYEATPNRDSSGMVRRESDVRSEFLALRQAPYVDAAEPLTDPRTRGFADGYLKPLHITSMLEAIIRVPGRNLGLLGLEYVDTPHRWEPDEIAFACQLADKIGLALMAQLGRPSEERRRETEAALDAAQAISERKRAEERLRSANTLLTIEMETSPDGILAVDPRGRVLSANRRFLEMWRLPFESVLGSDDASLLAAVTSLVKNPDAFLARVQYLYAHPDETCHEEIEMTDGRCFERHTAVLRSSPGHEPLGRVWYFRDISDRKRAEARVWHKARHDGLTGLVNRGVFVEEVRNAIARTGRGAQPFAILYLDLDHFKDVNDTLGHTAGDELLQAVAERLQARVRRTDTVARFGGDEFAVIAADVGDPRDAAALADVLIKAVGEPFWIRGHEVYSGASVGIAVYAQNGGDAETLLAHADVALYRAKSDGRHGYRFFTDAMDTDVRTRLALGSELRTALAAGEFFLLYQPQVEIATGRITGVEALLRWRHPQRGVLTPDEFVHVAEENGLIIPIGQWVLGEACRQTRRWVDAGVAPGRIAVNLSAVQFKVAHELESDIDAALAQAGLPAPRLELELTEAVLMMASREHSGMLDRLRAKGIKLAIDDFGTGYSSLDYLRRFPVDRIKIAQDFIKRSRTVAGSAAIVKATIGLARDLDIAVMAEGVDSDEEVALLSAWGCLDAQGFFFAEPLTADLLTPMLEGAGITRPRIAPAAAIARG